jgi:two-component system, OmpR family, alkaline phosphatase synthesis response regulator PhoP
MKILVAENEPMVQKLLSTYLNRAGFDVVTANNGKSAIQLFKTENPDLVVTGLMMPAANGAEVISYIRHTAKCSTPIVVITNIGLPASITNTLSLGADAYILKPLQLNEVLAQIHQLIHQ